MCKCFIGLASVPIRSPELRATMNLDGSKLENKLCNVLDIGFQEIDEDQIRLKQLGTAALVKSTEHFLAPSQRKNLLISKAGPL